MGDMSVDLVVTSPPYPMIEMWDSSFQTQDNRIADTIASNPRGAWEMMHEQLDAVWNECFRVMKPGAFLCINIGDATRTINGEFRLFNNHARIISACLSLGFTPLPCIIWRKPTNSPNKFMGSGMLPCGAYVTLEHEWILIFRKGEKRTFKDLHEKEARMKSSFFWEERNMWFSDLWDVKGTRQRLKTNANRSRSAAYPIEIPWRLINMFSQKSDTVLDPFAGTGTTALAAVMSGRNSVGFEIDPTLQSEIDDTLGAADIDKLNVMIRSRLDNHNEFVNNRISHGKEVKYHNHNLEVAVMTRQEEDIELQYVRSITKSDGISSFEASYYEPSNLQIFPTNTNLFNFSHN